MEGPVRFESIPVNFIYSCWSTYPYMTRGREPAADTEPNVALSFLDFLCCDSLTRHQCSDPCYIECPPPFACGCFCRVRCTGGESVGRTGVDRLLAPTHQPWTRGWTGRKYRCPVFGITRSEIELILLSLMAAAHAQPTVSHSWCYFLYTKATWYFVISYSYVANKEIITLRE